jgi:hypothetical protein
VRDAWVQNDNSLKKVDYEAMRGFKGKISMQEDNR